MYLEIRKKGKKKLYYLAHSFRDNGKVRKIRRYLGADLSKNQLDKLRKRAGEDIKKRIESQIKIGGPFQTILSPQEIKEIDTLIARGKIKLAHLEQEDWQKFTELFTYNTNAIEGSTVKLSEVEEILEEDKWPPNRSKEEISETYGGSEAVNYIRKTKDHLSSNLMKELHRIIFKNSKPFAGNFRGKGMEVVVVDSLGNIIHRGAPQPQVISLLKELITWYEKNEKTHHPILLAAVVHNQFENIHPFQDGNGRIGRLLLDNILLKHNFPPVNINLKNRAQYYSALHAYENNHNLRPTLELILKEYKALNKILKK
jgi:Fic family protein